MDDEIRRVLVDCLALLRSMRPGDQEADQLRWRIGRLLDEDRPPPPVVRLADRDKHH